MLEQPWLPIEFKSLSCEEIYQLSYILDQIDTDSDTKIIIDVGCFIGGFTKVMAKYAKYNNGIVHSIDLFDSSNVTLNDIHKKYNVMEFLIANLSIRGLLKYVVINKIDSISYSKNFLDKSVDFVFIDANHSHEAVKNDILSWLPKIKKGGIIAGHDYEFEDYDEQYVNLDGHGDRHHGVIKAVNEIFGKVNYKYTIWHKEIV